ncbi:MAG: DUF3416 domain-containing protein [Candidatus Cloacimonetes bacterium]|nr:DUF3416 domain-containing protein [Candidatus Cloacimonadota bacterium]
MQNRRIKIKEITPRIDDGKYNVKWEIDIPFTVTVSVSPREEFSNVYLKYKKQSDKNWRTAEMQHKGREKYSAEFFADKIGFYEYTIEAVSNNGSITSLDKTFKVYFHHPQARFAAWYEMWSRSQGKIEGKSATFKDMEARLSEIHKMGFDTIYLAPIYPVGHTNKKGSNNTLIAGLNDPGSPYSIGNEFGGHKTVNPELGTLNEFRKFLKKANQMGIEIALDIVLTCSLDHHYVKEHPDWFFYNEDGTVKYAENPPKKYQDIYPLNFYPEDKDEMWNEMKSIFIFWIQQGVKTFRVDNPHTKPVEFWEWLIKEVRSDYPDIIFLAEAFTEPPIMKLLAKIGFTQSYTYFTWRNSKKELTEYLTELTQSEMKYYFRGNLFTNTPDILMPILQKGGRPAFKMRIALASTLSSIYGIYNGFELCENKAITGTEEYVNSEKYQYKVWDWNRPGNIKAYIAKLNKIRRENSALHYYRNLEFYKSSDENIIFYGKTSYDKKNTIFIAVNLDPFNTHKSILRLPISQFGISENDEYEIEELITGKTYKWYGFENEVELDPKEEPAMIFKI